MIMHLYITNNLTSLSLMTSRVRLSMVGDSLEVGSYFVTECLRRAIAQHSVPFLASDEDRFQLRWLGTFRCQRGKFNNRGVYKFT
jgi:hypothetical protein